jgi:hypothetical protein
VTKYERYRRKHEKRREFSVKGSTYARLQQYADERGLSVSGCLEVWVHENLDAHGAPHATVVDARPGIPRKRHSGVHEF